MAIKKLEPKMDFSKSTLNIYCTIILERVIWKSVVYVVTEHIFCLFDNTMIGLRTRNRLIKIGIIIKVRTNSNLFELNTNLFLEILF